MSMQEQSKDITIFRIIVPSSPYKLRCRNLFGVQQFAEEALDALQEGLISSDDFAYIRSIFHQALKIRAEFDAGFFNQQQFYAHTVTLFADLIDANEETLVLPENENSTCEKLVLKVGSGIVDETTYVLQGYYQYCARMSQQIALEESQNSDIKKQQSSQQNKLQCPQHQVIQSMQSINEDNFSSTDICNQQEMDQDQCIHFFKQQLRESFRQRFVEGGVHQCSQDYTEDQPYDEEVYSDQSRNEIPEQRQPLSSRKFKQFSSAPGAFERYSHSRCYSFAAEDNADEDPQRQYSYQLQSEQSVDSFKDRRGNLSPYRGSYLQGAESRRSESQSFNNQHVFKWGVDTDYVTLTNRHLNSTASTPRALHHRESYLKYLSPRSPSNELLLQKLKQDCGARFDDEFFHSGKLTPITRFRSDNQLDETDSASNPSEPVSPAPSYYALQEDQQHYWGKKGYGNGNNYNSEGESRMWGEKKEDSYRRPVSPLRGGDNYWARSGGDSYWARSGGDNYWARKGGNGSSADSRMWDQDRKEDSFNRGRSVSPLPYSMSQSLQHNAMTMSHRPISPLPHILPPYRPVSPLPSSLRETMKSPTFSEQSFATQLSSVSNISKRSKAWRSQAARINKRSSSITECTLTEDAYNMFDELIDGTYKWLQFEMTPNNQHIFVTNTGDSTTSYKKLLSHLHSDRCCYIVYNQGVTRTQKSGSPKIILINWRPEGSPGKQRMLYASYKDVCKSCLGSISLEVQATEISDLDESSVLSKIRQ